MAEVKVEGPELKKLVKLTKKKPLAFAFSPGKKKEEHIFAIDRRKSDAFLAKKTKKESTGMKVAHGTCELKGKLLTMTCEKTVPTMAKTLKAYLKTQKIMVNIEILDADGNALESDIEELPDDPSMDEDDDLVAADEDAAEDQAADTAADDDDDDDDAASDDAARKKELAERLKAAQPGVAAASGAAGETLKKVLAAAVGMIKSDDLDKAEETVDKLEAAIAKVSGAAEGAATPAADAPAGPDPRALAARAGELKKEIDAVEGPAKDKLLAALGTAAQAIKGGQLEAADGALTKISDALGKMGAAATPADDADAAKWATAEGRLQPLVDKAIAEKRGDLDAINRAFNYAKDLAAEGAYERALAAAGKVAELLKAAESMTTTAAAADAMENIPADVVPYVQSRLAWIETRKGLRAEMETLKSAIDAATAGVEGLEDVPAKSSVLFSYLSNIDENLESTLEQLVETPDGDAREKLKDSARSIIADYRKELDADFFKAVDDNGFVSTNIRGAALDSLDKVSQALAA